MVFITPLNMVKSLIKDEFSTTHYTTGQDSNKRFAARSMVLRAGGVLPIHSILQVCEPLDRVSSRNFCLTKHAKGFTFDILPYKGVSF